MRKLIIVSIILFVIPSITFAQRRGSPGSWNITVSGGGNIASMDSKMQLYDGDKGNFEDYTGYGGVEGQVGIKVGRIETSYILQYYFAKKDGKALINGVSQDEVGDLDFFNELLEISYYIIDEPILKGLTFDVGIGKGTSRIVVNGRSFDGVDESDIKMYGKILHYHGSLHYRILDWLEVKLTYRALNINTVDQPNFNNSTYTATIGFIF